MLPLPDGPGKAIKLTVHPVRAEIPLYLAAVGPKNLELTGEIADGWLGIFFSPEQSEVSMAPLRAGRERGGRATGDDVMSGFDIVPTVPVVFGEDVEACAAPVRGYTALYLGGMGSRDKNFYNQLAVRMGYDEAAAKVQDLFLERKHREAAEAVPHQLIDSTALIGPPERVRDRLAAYAEAGVTTLTVSAFDATLDQRLHTIRTMAEVLDASGLGA